MIRWLIVVFLALILFNGLMPWLQKLGFGRLPGDFRFRLFGREWFIPLTTTILLSGLAALACGIRISKSARTSNWANPRLTEAQLVYAANDAYAAARVYHALGLT